MSSSVTASSTSISSKSFVSSEASSSPRSSNTSAYSSAKDTSSSDAGSTTVLSAVFSPEERLTYSVRTYPSLFSPRTTFSQPSVSREALRVAPFGSAPTSRTTFNDEKVLPALSDAAGSSPGAIESLLPAPANISTSLSSPASLRTRRALASTTTE